MGQNVRGSTSSPVQAPRSRRLSSGSMTSEAANLFPIYESQVPSFQMPDINNDLGRDFVCETFSQSSQKFSHERNWQESDESQKLSRLQNFNSWMTKLNQNANFAKFQGHKGYFLTNVKVIYYYKAFGSRYFCISFSHERKSERIERKFKTQNPALRIYRRKWVGRGRLISTLNFHFQRAVVSNASKSSRSLSQVQRTLFRLGQRLSGKDFCKTFCFAYTLGF